MKQLVGHLADLRRHSASERTTQDSGRPLKVSDSLKDLRTGVVLLLKASYWTIVTHRRPPGVVGASAWYQRATRVKVWNERESLVQLPPILCACRLGIIRAASLAS